MPAIDWEGDLAFAIETIARNHPCPHRSISARMLRRRADELRDQIPAAPSAAAAELMRLVALIGDGHTQLLPTGRAGFARWLPLRCYWFTDGIHITAADESLAELLGGRVVRVGGAAAEDAARRVAALQGADNELAQRERIHFLSSGEALQACGLTDSPDRVEVEVATAAGSRALTLPTRADPFEDDRWMYWGEVYGAPSLPLVAALGRAPADELRSGRQDLPLHARSRTPLWHAWLPESRTLYLQSLFIQDWRGRTFEQLYGEALAESEALPVERVVLDLRYNSGGDGGRLIPLVHQFIRRDDLNRPHRLFVLTGRKTFSAGVMLARLMELHTRATFVGEPMGAPYNHAGDAASFRLPSSGMTLRVSTRFHQLSSSDDRRRVVPVQIPAQFSSADYLSGGDPALAAALAHEPRDSPLAALRDGGAELARAAYARQRAAHGGLAWWQPFTWESMNRLGYALLREGRAGDAVAAFEMSAEQYPGMWEAWDSLGDGYEAAGDPRAAEAFRRSLELSPGNAHARERLAG